MNRKLIVSILAIILVIAMIFSLLLAVIPVGRAESLSFPQSAPTYCTEQTAPGL